MNEILYDLNSVGIAAVLFAAVLASIEGGYRLGYRLKSTENASSLAQINAIQASLLGVLALLLGFTFSLALQRYDSRSAAVIDEANAIGTAYLRAQMLPADVRGDVEAALRQYLDLRVQAGVVSLDHREQHRALLTAATRQQETLWHRALKAADEDGSPVRTGLFIESLNEMIDSYGRRDAALKRHVPEVVLFLLFGTFLMTGSIVGYASGAAGHRASFATYIMTALIVLLVFMIVDLDRPRRGLIEVSQRSMTDLQSQIAASPAAEAAGAGSSR